MIINLPPGAKWKIISKDDFNRVIKPTFSELWHQVGCEYYAQKEDKEGYNKFHWSWMKVTTGIDAGYDNYPTYGS